MRRCHIGIARPVGMRRIAGLAIVVVSFVAPVWAVPSYNLARIPVADTDLLTPDQFGFAAAISGNTAVIGAPFKDSGAVTVDAGGAYLVNILTNSKIALTPPSAFPSERFGFSVSISGDKAVVGAIGGVGSAYVYNAATGAPLSPTLNVSDIDVAGFGESVSISGNTVVVGAQRTASRRGAVYAFNALDGTQLFLPRLTGPFTDAYFGESVAVSGGTILVGANTEVAYLYNASDGHPLDHNLKPPAGTTNDSFGASVSIDGNMAIVGAPNTGSGKGAAYLFDVATGNLLQTWSAASISALVKDFGCSVSLSGDYAIVGADKTNGPPNLEGAAFVFNIHTGDRVSDMTAADPLVNGRFGRSVSISGGTAIVGAANDPADALGAGAAYVNSPLPGDYNLNGIVDAADYTIWRDTLGSTSDLRANGDNAGASLGKIDQADYSFWISHFGQHSGSGAASSAVPEPSTYFSAVIAFIGVANPWLFGHRRKRSDLPAGQK
jgi:FG-GAP repeat